MNRLNGKVAIITGAAGYLGSATARLFAGEGARVVCADINVERLEALVGDIAATGGVAHAFEVDVTDERQIVGMVDFAVKTHGRLDVLHNNATAASGLHADGDIVSTPDAEWD